MLICLLTAFKAYYSEKDSQMTTVQSTSYYGKKHILLVNGDKSHSLL